MKINLYLREIRLLSPNEFRLGRKATEATNNVCSPMGENVFSIRTAQHCFNRFKNGNLELNDLPRSGRPMELDVELLKQIIEEDLRMTSRDLARQLGCSYTAVEKYLNELDETWRYEVWIPNELSTHQLQYRVNVSMGLMTSHRNYQWLRNLITGDEKWVLYINYKHRRQWLSPGETDTATPKSYLHSKKVMLSIWWRVNGIIHWEILSSSCIMTADLYYQQLDQITQKFKEKQDRIYYLYDNARSHVAKSIHEKLLELRWIPVLHLPYSSDLAPTGSHSFRSLSNHLREEKFNDRNDVKIDLINFFGEKFKDLYEGGILSLLERWRRVIDSDGAYITES